MDFLPLVDRIGTAVDILGVIAIALGIIVSLSFYLTTLLHGEEPSLPYTNLRNNLGRTILLGLEFLVAGDIIRSIATPPTITTVFILAVIVLIRAFLSMQFEKETEGYFPWEKRHREKTS